MTRLIKINVVDRTNLDVSPIKKLLSKFLSRMQLEPVYGPQVYTLRGLNFKLHVTKFQPNLIIVNVDQIVAGEDLPVEKLKQECKDTLIVGLSTMKSKNEVKKLGYDGYLHTIFNAQELQRVFDENGVDINELPSADEPIDIPHVDVKKHEQQVEQNQTEQETQESVQDDTKNDLDNTSVDNSSNVTDSAKPVEQEAPQPESKPEPVNDVQDDVQSIEPVQSEQQSESDVKPVEAVKAAENIETVNSDTTSNNDSDTQNKSSVQPVQEKQDVQDSDNTPVDNKLQEQQPEPAQSEEDDEGDDAEIDDLMPDMEDLGAEVGLDDSDDSDNDSNDDTANTVNSTIDDTQPVQSESAEDSNQQQNNSQTVQNNQSEPQNTQVDVQNVNNVNSQPQAEQTAQADRGADNNEHNVDNSENSQTNPAQPKPVQDTSVDQLNNVLNGGNDSGNADPVMAPTENGPKTPNLGGSDEPKKKKKVITDNWKQTHMSNINVKPQTESDSDDDLKNFTAMLQGKIPTAEDEIMNQANQQGTIN